MPGMNGADILLLVNTGTPSVPVWTECGGQRDCSFEETNDEIDMSSKDSRRKRIIAGRYTSTLSMDALYVPDNAAFIALNTALRDGELIKVRREESGVAYEEANALITSMTTEAPDQDAATIAIELTLDDGWTELTS